MIDLSLQGPVATLMINRPKSLNALNREVIETLSKTIAEIEDLKNVRVVKVCGAGDKAFVAGADISAMKGMSPEDASSFAQTGQDVFMKMGKARAIYIACVQGFALGGGCELALACDLIFASPQAVFGLPEVSLGLIPGFGGTQRLSRLIGISKAKELILTGQKIKAAEALSLGLVNQVFEENFDENIDAFIGRILKQGPHACAFAKQAIEQGFEKDLDQAMHVEQKIFAQCFEGQESQVGIEAFLNKEKPNWG